MTLSILSQQSSPNAYGPGTWAASAVSTTTGRRLRVVHWCVGSSNNAIQGNTLTLTSSGGGVTSWTSLAATTDALAWGFGARVWVADQNADGTSITITVGAAGENAEAHRIIVIDDDDYTAGGATATGTDADGDGALTLTLSAAPASSSVVIGVLCGVVDTGGTGGASPDTGWTTYGTTATRTDWWTLHAMSRTGSTSTSVSWADICTGPPGFVAVALAFEVLQGGSSPALAQTTHRWGNDDGSESAHTWAAAEGADHTAEAGDRVSLNVLINVTANPGARRFTLQYRKVGDALWDTVPTE